MQAQWQENYVITAGPTGTTISGGASGSSQASGDASWYEDGSGFAESDSSGSGSSSGSGYSDASGASWASGFSGQDHYKDQSSWSEPYNLVGLSSSGTTVDNVWGDTTTTWSNGTWSSWQGPSSGSGSGSGASSATSGSFSTSYDQDVGYSGFSQEAGVSEMGSDSGWTWGVGWAGAGRNGPLGPSAYSGLGYTFAPGVTVAPVNDQFDAEGQAVSVQVQASGSGVVYSAQGLPAGVAINASTGLISGTIAAGAYAAGPLYVSTVTYTDAAGASASQSFVWLISDPVTLTNPGDQSGTEGVGVDLIPTATDVNGGDLFTWTQTGLPAGLSLDPDGGAITGTPAAGSAGVYVVTLTATDLGGASASQAFVWTVAPAVTITDPGLQSNTEGDSVSLPIQATDATGGTLTFSETGLPPGLALSSGGLITGQISAGDAANGPYFATITAGDGTYSATQTVLWLVSDPVTVADPGPQSSSADDPVSLQIRATDTTGGTPTFTATGLPPGLSISNSGQITGDPTTAGFYDVTVTATDGAYSGSTTVGWDVADSAVSLVDPESQSSTEGDAVTLQLQATDAEGLPLEYSADGLPAGLSLNAQTGAVTGTIAAGAAGFYVTTITAADADFASASQTFIWNVAPAVTITDPGRQKSTEGDTVSLQIQATDATGTPTFSATGLPSGLSISSGGLISGTIAAGAAAQGPYDVTITASDGTYSATQTVAWSVAPAVTITDPGPQSNTEGDPINLQVNATDSAGTPTFSATDLPAGLQMSSGGAISGTVATGAAAQGPYDVTITATDGTYSATETVPWSVAAPAPAPAPADTAVSDAVFVELGQTGGSGSLQVAFPGHGARLPKILRATPPGARHGRTLFQEPDVEEPPPVEVLPDRLEDLEGQDVKDENFRDMLRRLQQIDPIDAYHQEQWRYDKEARAREGLRAATLQEALDVATKAGVPPKVIEAALAQENTGPSIQAPGVPSPKDFSGLLRVADSYSLIPWLRQVAIDAGIPASDVDKIIQDAKAGHPMDPAAEVLKELNHQYALQDRLTVIPKLRRLALDLGVFSNDINYTIGRAEDSDPSDPVPKIVAYLIAQVKDRAEGVGIDGAEVDKIKEGVRGLPPSAQPWAIVQELERRDDFLTKMAMHPRLREIAGRRLPGGRALTDEEIDELAELRRTGQITDKDLKKAGLTEDEIRAINDKLAELRAAQGGRDPLTAEQIKTYADAYASKVRANGGKTYNGLWDEIAGERGLSAREKTAIRDYIRDHPDEYRDVQPIVRNKNGKDGDPAHVATVERLADMARKEFPNDIIHKGESIKGRPGAEGLDRQPDVWVEDRATGRVKKVYEAARKDASGEFVPRELEKKRDYDKWGIPSYFEEVK